MKFGNMLKRRFNAEDGAYSIVTQREAFDPAITLDRYEKEVVDPVYKIVELHRGPCRGKEAEATRVFYDDLTGDPLSIFLHLPKAKGYETRLYNTGSSGFTPREGHVWYVYRKGGRLYIGSMTEQAWRGEGVEDPDDDAYLAAIESGSTDLVYTEVPQRITGQTQRYYRNPAFAMQVLEIARYRCEYNPRTKLFVSRVSRRPFLEAHHLIPIKHTDILQANLDVPENIVALAPHWHRAIHHADHTLVNKIVKTLYQRRRDYLDRINLSLGDLVELYRCQKLK